MSWRAPLLLFASIIFFSCSEKKQDLSNVSSGGLYIFENDSLKASKKWDIHIGELEPRPDSLRYDLKFFPKDYSIAGTVGRSGDKYYISIAMLGGLLEIDDDESVRFLDPYNSFLGDTGPIYDIVEVGDDTWFAGSEAVYRYDDGDLTEYRITTVTHPDVYPGKNHIWLTYSDRLYLVRDEAIVFIKMPEKVSSWVSGANGSIVGYTSTGRYIVSENGIIHKNKPASKFFPALFEGYRTGFWDEFTIGDTLFKLDPFDSKIYMFTDSIDYEAEYHFSEFTGISKTGELWAVGYDGDNYTIQVSENDWISQLVNDGRVEAITKTRIGTYNERWGQSFLRNDEEPWVLSSSNGIYVYRNEKLDTVLGRDWSMEKSIMGLADLAPGTYITNVRNDQWDSLLLSKALVVGPGFQFNLLFKTITDSNGNLWTCDNGKLLMQDGKRPGAILKEYDISEELNLHGEEAAESFSNRLLFFGTRTFVTTRDIVYIVGKYSLVTFDPATGKWDTTSMTGRGVEIDQTMIFEDKGGFVWFYVKGQGIMYHIYEQEHYQVLVPDGNGIDFWQIDADRKLTIARDGYLKVIDLIDMVPNSCPEIASYRLDPSILEFKKISAVVWNDGMPVLINSTGFYFWQ